MGFGPTVPVSGSADLKADVVLSFPEQTMRQNIALDSGCTVSAAIFGRFCYVTVVPDGLLDAMGKPRGFGTSIRVHHGRCISVQGHPFAMNPVGTERASQPEPADASS